MRVHILGASGCGTTTLGRAVSSALGIPQFDVDDYFWEPTEPPFRVKRAREARISLLHAALAPCPSWVLSGSMVSWGESFVPLIDLTVFLRAPTEVRLDRLRRRELRRFGADALAPGGAMHVNHEAFLVWAAGYDSGDRSTRILASHATWLEGVRCPVVQLDGTLEAELLLQAVLAYVNGSGPR